MVLPVPKIAVAERAVMDLADRIEFGPPEEREQAKPDFFTGVEHLRNLRHFPEFARRMLWIRDKATRRMVPFELNWIQRQILAHELRARRRGVRPWFLILKYRRGGVTTLQQGLCYQLIWAQPHKEVRTYAHRKEDTQTIFQMVVMFYDFQPKEFRHEKTGAGTYEIHFPKPWYSRYVAETAGATSSGRGAGFDRAHLSEGAHYPNLGLLHEGLNDTLTPDAAYVVESTAFGTTGKGAQFHEAWQKAKKGESAFIPLFFPWYSDPTNRIALVTPDELKPLSPEERDLKKRFGLSLPQVKWWRQKRLELIGMGQNARAIYQEHPVDDESVFLEGGDGYYDEDAIREVEAGTRDPIPPGDLTFDWPEDLRNDIDNGRLRIFAEPREGGRYLITADPAEGVGGDNSAASGWNVEDGEQVFAFAHNRYPPDVFGQRLDALGRVYRPNQHPDTPPAYVFVERENHGHAVLLSLLKLCSYPKAQIHHEVPETHDKKPPQPRAGWRHNHIVLTTELGRMLRENYPKIRDRETVASIRRVSLGDSGTAEFTGRDLAVTAGLAPIGFPYAKRRDLFY